MNIDPQIAAVVAAQGTFAIERDMLIAIVDPETHQRTTRQDDAERWARLLPFAYREGDLVVEVNEVEAAAPVGATFRYPGTA